MTTARHSPHQPSPLAHTLPNQDPFDSDSDQADSYTVDRMHIHIDMTDSHYLAAAAHHQDNIRSDCLPGTCSSEQPAALAYPSQDLAPYSAVSSFNYPASADPTLLTPVSSASSPPLQQRQSTKGLHYTSHAVSGPQQPTPPSTSGMYYPSYDISASSQSPSPLTVPPHAPEPPFDMVAPFMGQSPHPSPKEEVPPPIHPYLGHYTVSGTCNESEVPNSFSPYPDFNEVDPGFMARGQQHMQLGDQLHRQMVVTSAGQAPILTQPHHSQLRTQTTPRASGMEDLRDPGIMAQGLPGPDGYHTRISVSPVRRQPQRKQKAQQRRTPRASSRQQGQAQRPDAQQTDQNQPDDAECLPLKLSDNAPPEDKFLFELRQKFICEKGKGMWDDIAASYAAKYQVMEKAALQMKISRAVAKYGEWPDKEIAALVDAFKQDEEKRYERLLEQMKKLGGARVWDWKPQHIEAKLVSLGYEEPSVDERSHSRRRKRAAQRRRANSQNQQNAAIVGDWTNGLGLHPVLHPPPHGYPMGPQSSPYDGVNHQACMASNFTPEQNERILDDIFKTSIKPDPEAPLSPDAMEIVSEGNEGRVNTHTKQPNFDHNQRVARQACEQLVRPPPLRR